MQSLGVESLGVVAAAAAVAVLVVEPYCYDRNQTSSEKTYYHDDFVAETEPWWVAYTTCLVVLADDRLLEYEYYQQHYHLQIRNLQGKMWQNKHWKYHHPSLPILLAHVVR